MPEEPMYIILNTAMSSTWGFEPPPGCGNPNPCYDCSRAECACACPTNLCQNFPAAFLIDYVRVYQDSTNTDQVIGCSPDSHPTAAFIQGNQPLYMNNPPMPGEVAPLVSVANGGAACTRALDCGNGDISMGSCTGGVCVCSEAYTGPSCLASVGFDDVSGNLLYTREPPLLRCQLIHTSHRLSTSTQTMISAFMEFRIQTFQGQ